MEWVKRESPKYGGVSSAKWQREQEINWDVYGGERVWPMISREHHHVHIAINDNWAVFRVIDHGIRHPTCCLWVAVNRNGDRHFFREYYATDRSVALNCKQIIGLSPENEPLISSFIDPSTTKRVNYVTTDASQDKKGLIRLIDLYSENGISCSKADNAAAGYDKVTDGLLSTLARQAIASGRQSPYLEQMGLNQEQLSLLAGKPCITFDIQNTQRAFRETENLRWKELTGDEGQRSEPEKTVDVYDEGPDCVRYAVQSHLYWQRPVRRYHHDSYISQLERRHIKREFKRHHAWA